MAKYILSVVLLVLTLAGSLPAQSANRLIPFQGRLTDGTGKALNGVYTMIFNLYDEPTGGTSLWSETHQNVSVIAGQVNVILGSMTSLDDPDNNSATDNPLYFTQPRYLGITVGSESNQEMLPRHQLVPSFQSRIADRAFRSDHALQADNADKLGNKLPSHFVAQSNLNDVSSDLNGKIAANRSKIGTNSTEITATKKAIRSILPAGTVIAFAGGSAPSGFLEAKGQYVPKSTYAALYAVIGDRYGATPSDFKLPDYRGEFLRGWDHGRGIDPGRSIGSSQKATRVYYNDLRPGLGWGGAAMDIKQKAAADYEYGSPEMVWEGATPIGSAGDIATTRLWGIRVRPRNMAVMYCIKY